MPMINKIFQKLDCAINVREEMERTRLCTVKFLSRSMRLSLGLDCLE